MASARLIDWRAPWLAPLIALQPRLEEAQFHATLTQLTQLAQARGVVSGHGEPITFVAADDAGAVPYELHIARSGRVPTRHNLHDLFNAAVWLTYPRLKATMNRRQAQDLRAEMGGTARRGPQRDAATLLDESGLLLAVDERFASSAVFHAELRAHAWSTLFGAWRARWHQHWAPYLVGHAVMEKLVQPYAAITARVCVVAMAQDDIHDAAAVDAAAAHALERNPIWSSMALPPLPVLGIPGWWPANESPAFYANSQVFRPARSVPA